VLLVGASLVPGFLGLGPIYLVGAAAGGLWLLTTSIRLMREPGPRLAMANFHASLGQLSLLLMAAILDAMV
jgi:protoheme IX farnesyltransferase